MDCNWILWVGLRWTEQTEGINNEVEEVHLEASVDTSEIDSSLQTERHHETLRQYSNDFVGDWTPEERVCLVLIAEYECEKSLEQDQFLKDEASVQVENVLEPETTVEQVNVLAEPQEEGEKNCIKERDLCVETGHSQLRQRTSELTEISTECKYVEIGHGQLIHRADD